MADLERQPSAEKTSAAAEILSVGENAVQIALARCWADREGLAGDDNEIVRAWITNGYAERYRRFADAYQMRVDLSNERAIADLLVEIEKATVH